MIAAKDLRRSIAEELGLPELDHLSPPFFGLDSYSVIWH